MILHPQENSDRTMRVELKGENGEEVRPKMVERMGFNVRLNNGRRNEATREAARTRG